jgi:hypothetical protein
MREITKGILLFQILLIVACSTTKQVVNPKNEDIKEFVGKKVTLIGKTVNMKLGAVLVLENGQRIWMDEMESWPNGFYTEKESKSVQVTGVLIERYDLPVFVPSNDSIVKQGIPVPKGTDLKEASHRYLMKNYDWNEIK